MNNRDNQKEVIMPVRVELSHLMIIDGYYFLNNELFNGLAYDHRDKRLNKVYQITEGKISAEQEYGFFHRPGLVKLDFAVISDYFDAEFGEALWIDGYNVESVGWYPDGSGLVSDYDTDYDEYKCKFEWHYKQLKSVKISQNPNTARVGFSVTFNQQNKIEFCALYGDNVATLGQLVTRTDLPLPSTLTELFSRYTVADTIELNINNEVNFNYFITHTSFQLIQTLTLQTRGLSLPALAPLIDLPHLQEIFFNESGLSEYELQSMPEQEQLLKQQQCDERNHALLNLLFAIQAKQNCKIRLDADSGIMFIYNYPANVLADVNQCDFDYLLKTLPLERITELELRQSNLPIASLQKLVKFSHLKRLSLKENSIYDYSHTELDDEAKAIAQRQSDKRNQALWSLLINLQAQLHCDIKLISQSLEEFEQPYRG